MESFIIESNRKERSRIPAWLDLAQSGTGLILGLFMWVHMLLVASIILGKGSFNFVAKTMELSFLSSTGHGYPIAVFFAVSGVFTLFILHALLGMRKFPISWQQHRIIRDQMGMMNHTDTNLWYIQVLTGFIMFFAGSVHLYTMLTHPGSIDPYLSADRVVSSHFWFLYLILLVCVELHATIGLYRLCMKWGWFQGKNFKTARENRKKLKQLKNRLTIFFLSVGALALLVFIVIGIGHRDRVGQPYKAHSAEVKSADTVNPAVEEVAVEKEAVGESHETKASVEEATSVEKAADVHEAEPAVPEVHETAAEAEPAHGTEDDHSEAGHSEPAVHDTAHEPEKTHQ